MADPQNTTLHTETTSLLDPERQESQQQIAKQRRDELKGYVLMGLSALGFATNSACVKALALSNFPSLQIVFARSVMQLALGLLGCLYYRANPLDRAHTPELRKLLFLRGAAGAFGNACFFYAVSVMTLADATVVFFTGPVFSAIFANWLLGEPYGAFDRAASAVCMLGIVLVLKPLGLFGSADDGIGDLAAAQPEMHQARGAAAALIGAMSGALAYCVVRKVGKAVHSMVHVVYFGFLSLVGSAIAMWVLQEPRMPATAYEWTVMGLVGVFAFAGQAMLNRGLQLAPAGPGTLMRNLDVVFAFLFGIALFGEVPDWISVAGAAVIIGCTMAMGAHKWLSHRRRG
ncbi:hypothetical protein GGI07_000639 [Coemansia sp. Benny D115]|nr:hypothetical protein GGI07_000639 [Coemansia sp. Benny D115]